MSPTNLRAVKAINPGRVLKVIGSIREISLAEYDKIILFYQYEVCPIRKEFVEFCERNRGSLKDASLIIDIPTTILEDGIEETLTGLTELIGYFDSLNSSGMSARLVNTNCTKENKQKKYATDLGIGYESVFDKKILTDAPVIVTIFTPSNFDLEISKKRATAYMIGGVLAVPLGIMLFVIGVVLTNSPPAAGAAFTLVSGGPILYYMAYRSKKFTEWRGNP